MGTPDFSVGTLEEIIKAGHEVVPVSYTHLDVYKRQTQKRIAWINDATKYAADMNLILAYHNLIDDWNDDRSYTKKAFAKMLDKDYTCLLYTSDTVTEAAFDLADRTYRTVP